MEYIYKYAAGATTALIGLLAPVQGLAMCAIVFVAIDFFTGIAAGRKRAARLGEPWCFSSDRAWSTIHKTVFMMVGIALAWLIDSQIITFVNLRLANIFTGFVCGVEFWSYLENAAEISDHPMFNRVRKLLKKRLEEQIGDFGDDKPREDRPGDKHP